jgi:hypothetical protein
MVTTWPEPDIRTTAARWQALIVVGTLGYLVSTLPGLHPGHGALTGLANRRGFCAEAQGLLAASVPFGLLLRRLPDGRPDARRGRPRHAPARRDRGGGGRLRHRVLRSRTCVTRPSTR